MMTGVEFGGRGGKRFLLGRRIMASLLAKSPGHGEKRSMKKCFVAAALLLGGLLAEPSGAASQPIDWEPQVYPSGQLFPSLIIGTAAVRPEDEVFPVWTGEHIGDPQGIVGVSAVGVPKGSKVEVVVQENDVMKTSRVSGTVSGKEEELTVYPKISWKYDRLAAVKQAVPLDITVEMKVDGESLGEKTETCTLRTVNDCLFGVDAGDGSDETADFSWLFTAYVNENHPWVDRTLKEALATKIVDSFDAYQSGDPEKVLMQIFSIWNVMQRKGFRYSDITATAAEKDGVYSQHVRLFDESLVAGQANCVDGSVLLAAVLRKIGLSPLLVLVPGHMYLAVWLDDDTLIGIETTLMGAADLAEVDAKRLRSFLKFEPEEQKNIESWQTFEAAVESGSESLEQVADKLDSEALDYQLIDLEDARRLGILPISSALRE